MLLSYIDEAGINYKIGKDGDFHDGHFVIYFGLLIPECKYFHIERSFSDLLTDILGITDWEDRELHGYKIWSDARTTADKDNVRKYFEELCQLVSKLRLPIVVGLRFKDKSKTSDDDIEEDISRGVYAFLSGLEHKLSNLNETGILIADSSNHDTLLERAILDRIQWRYKPRVGLSRAPISKYVYETRSNFFVDHLHSDVSHRSLFIQLVDNVCFVFKRFIEFYYLENILRDPANLADESKCPIPRDVFMFLNRCNPEFYYFNESEKDVCASYGIEELIEHMRVIVKSRELIS